MGLYLGDDRTTAHAERWCGSLLYGKPRGARWDRYGIAPKVAGNPAPGCLFDVPISFNNQGRIARVTSERGAILPLMAIVILVLMGAAAMAVDLGWLYYQSLEIQHGADAAALAGVIHEPGQRMQAHVEAIAAAAKNGFDDTSLDTAVSVVDFLDDPAMVEHNGQLRVTVTHRVDTFFLPIFGINDVDIARTALAEYVQPLALGSPESYFGNDPAQGIEQGLWGSIHGTYTRKRDGDRFATLCDAGGSGPACAPNPEARPAVNWGTADAEGGYLYGIEVADGAAGLVVEIFDGHYYKDGTLSTWTGDGSPGGSENIVTWFMLYGPDPTPLDTTDGNELLCSVQYNPRADRESTIPGWDDDWDDFDEADPAILASMWDSMATSSDRQGCAASFDRGPGTYPLRVLIEHTSSEKGKNKYSLRASTTSGPSPQVSGLGDMSIASNVESGGATDFYLARVEERNAGTMLVVELWDPGDISGGNGSDNVQIFDGFGSIPDCDWSATNGDTGTGPCVIVTGNKIFNGHLITIRIPIPDTYTCSGDTCWYRIRYNYPSGNITDSTTWAAYIEGNPVSLIE